MALFHFFLWLRTHLSVFCSVQLGLGPCKSHFSLRVGSLLGFANWGNRKKLQGWGRKILILFCCCSCWHHCSSISSPWQGRLIHWQLAPICWYLHCKSQTHHSLSDASASSRTTLLKRLSPSSGGPSSKPVSQHCPTERTHKSEKFKFSSSRTIKIKNRWNKCYLAQCIQNIILTCNQHKNY